MESRRRPIKRRLPHETNAEVSKGLKGRNTQTFTDNLQSIRYRLHPYGRLCPLCVRRRQRAYMEEQCLG